MLSTDPGDESARHRPPPSLGNSLAIDPIDRLTERQRAYLRLVLENRNSKEIAAATGSSHRAVDKQLMKANNLLGVQTRFEAARILAAHDSGVEQLPPANALPPEVATFPLPSPLPTAGKAANLLTWRQVVSWVAIISIATPLGLTAAGMAIVTLLILLGFIHL